MMPTIAPGGHDEAEVVDQQAVAEALGDVLELDHLVAQALARRDEDLVGLVAALVVDRLQLLDALPGAPCPWCGRPWRSGAPTPVPCWIAFWRAFSPRLFLLQALVLLLQPVGVVALPRDAAAAVELEDPLGGVVEEVAVVGDRDHGAGVAGEELLQPLDRFGVEVVGRFVEQQHVRLLQQQAAQRDAALLAAGQLADDRRPTAAGAARRRRLPAGAPACARRRLARIASRRCCSAASLSKSAPSSA